MGYQCIHISATESPQGTVDHRIRQKGLTGMKGYIALLAVLLVVGVTARPKKKFTRPVRWFKNGRVHGGLVPKPTERVGHVKAAQVAYFTQQVDHFGGSTDTYTQRYWYNKELYQKGGPVFLMLGGESEENPYWLEGEELPFYTMAKEHNAFLFLLEHRFYGETRPTDDMSTDNLKYLSSEQALEDMAAFIKQMNNDFDLTGSKWITFGGSYSGALSGWAREKYPDLVYAAVATSGPVFAETDFKEYLEVVHNALTTYSSTCGENVQKGFDKIRATMATSSGRSTLQDMFKLCDAINYEDPDYVSYFYEAIIGNYMGIVQYSGDNAGKYHDYLTIKTICQYHMDDSVDPMEQVANVNKFMMDYYYEDCLDLNFKEWIEYAQNTAFGQYSSDTRAWLWQTCTEFGYYQSTDSDDDGTYWGHVMDANYYVKQCEMIFGSQFTNASVYNAADQTNQHYGGRDNFKGTRVVFPNGSNDPWHALGILKSKLPDYNAILIQGTSHCADMYPPSSEDPTGLTAARATIKQLVDTWVAQ